MAQQNEYVRFSLAQRIEHFILILSFTTLAVTGLPQKFPDSNWAITLIGLLGGIQVTRIIHHTAAIVFVAQSIYHALVLGYKVFVLRTELSMLPGVKDITDAIGVVRYNLGLIKTRPEMPRYNFTEKAEYWAMLWGTVVMAFTGFMLWNPIAVTTFLPGSVIPAAKAAHGGEALLAVLAIIVWHFYNVHLKAFNRSMFTGKLHRHEMAEEHGEELARIEAGAVRPKPRPEVIRRRRRSYLPIAAVIGLVLAAGLYWLVTFETTALATVPPPADDVDVFAPLEPTPTATRLVEPTPADEPDAQQIAGAVPHPIEGQEDCVSCHGLDGIVPFPEDHEGRPNDSCLACHEPGEAGAPAATDGAPAAAAMDIPHPIEGREDCVSCHGLDGIVPFPADHEDRTNESCTACHALAEGAATEGTPETEEESEGAGTAGVIPHPIEGQEECEACHGLTAFMPFPPDHTGFSNEICTGCHTLAAGEEGTPEAEGTPASETPEADESGTTQLASAIPHPIEGQEQCTACHGLASIMPYPADHEGREDEGCINCHRPAEPTPEE